MEVEVFGQGDAQIQPEGDKGTKSMAQLITENAQFKQLYDAQRQLIAPWPRECDRNRSQGYSPSTTPSAGGRLREHEATQHVAGERHVSPILSQIINKLRQIVTINHIYNMIYLYT